MRSITKKKSLENSYLGNKESPKTSFTDEDVALRICSFLEEKKASRILLLDLHKVNSYFKYFLIASANSVLHLSSLGQEINKVFGKRSKGSVEGTRGKSRQGNRKLPLIGNRKQLLPVKESHSGWIVLDLAHIDTLAHLFLEEQRSFYNLERLWGDADFVYPKGS